jgi:hypothetical protein
MKTLFTTAFASLLLLSSCASDANKKKDTASTPPPRKSLSERLNEKNGFKQDSEGNWKVESDRRSPYENQGATYDAKKSYKKTDYKTGDFLKKSWSGNKTYDRKSYAGNTDGSRFQKASALQGEKAPEASNQAKIPGAYKTETYATNAANETRSKAITKGSSAAIDSKQKTFQQPEIIDWKAQRSLSLEQSKGILGN